MRTRISLGLALLAATLATASVVGPRGRMSSRRPSAGPSVFQEESPIEPLDRCIQRRLHEKPGFGMARILVSPVHLREFKAESTGESEALAALSESGWTVGLTLAGRELLGPEQTVWSDDLNIGQPVVVTEKKLPPDMPRAGDLRPIGRRALAASETADSASGKLGRWSVEARVVRADRKSCLDCHSPGDGEKSTSGDGIVRGPLKIGDALGVVIYVFSRDRRADDPGSSTPSRREIP